MFFIYKLFYRKESTKYIKYSGQVSTTDKTKLFETRQATVNAQTFSLLIIASSASIDADSLYINLLHNILW